MYAIVCSEDLFAASQISWKLDSCVAGIFLILLNNLFLKSINKIFANAQFQIFLKKVAKQKAQSPISQSTCSRSVGYGSPAMHYKFSYNLPN